MQELKIGLGWKLDRLNAGIKVIKTRFRKLNRDLRRSAVKVGEGYQGMFEGGALVAGGGLVAFQLGNQLAEHSRGFEKLQTATKTSEADMGKLRHAVYDLNQALGMKSTAKAQESMLETAPVRLDQRILEALHLPNRVDAQAIWRGRQHPASTSQPHACFQSFHPRSWGRGGLFETARGRFARGVDREHCRICDPICRGRVFH